MVSSSIYAIFFNQLSKDVKAINATLLLYTFSFLFSFPQIAFIKGGKRVLQGYWKEIFFIGFFTILANYCIAMAMIGLSPAVVQVLQRADVFFGAFLGWYFFKEQLSNRLWFCIFLAILGVFLMSAPFLQAKGSSQTMVLDYAFALFATLLYALTQVIAKKIVGQVKPATINSYRLLFSNLILWVWFSLSGHSLHLSPHILFYGAVSGFFGPFLTRQLLMSSSRYLPLSHIFVIVTSTPVLTIFLQFIFFQYVLTANELVGAFSILVAVVILNLSSFKNPMGRKK